MFHKKVFPTYNNVHQQANGIDTPLWNRCWIWKVLLVTGFYHKKYPSRYTYFAIKFLPFIFLHFRAGFSIFLLSKSGKFTKSSVAAITMNICSIFAWHCMNCSEKYFRPLFMHITKIQKSNMNYQFAENRRTNMRLLMALFLPFVFSGSMIKAYIYDRNPKYAKFWLFGNNLHETPELELTAIFVSAAIYYSVFLNASVFVVIYVSFCNTLSNAFSRNLNASNSDQKLCEILNFICLTISCCELLENLYSNSIAIVLLQFSAGVFMALSLLLGFSVNPASVILQEAILVIIVCSALFTSAVIAGSRIPRAVDKIRFKYKDLYHKEKIDEIIYHNTSKERLTLLKTLSKIKPFYLTACGTLAINKTLIVSSFGCFLTYGFLLIQLNLV